MAGEAEVTQELIRSESPTTEAPPNDTRIGLDTLSGDDGDVQLGIPASARPRTSVLGTLNILIIFAGSVVSLSTLGLMCYLWQYSPGFGYSGLPPAFWARIVLSGWLPQVITISAAFLRSVIAIQAAVCMSVVASLCLERSGIPVEHVPIILTARGFGSSPYALAGFCVRSIREVSRLQYVAVILAVMATTLLSQLTSTFLLGDLENTLVLNGTFSESLGVGISVVPGEASRIDTERGVEYWKSRIPEYPTFAEYSPNAGSSVDWRTDTGPTLRAFLPLRNATSRRRISKYEGIAGLVDTRFVCVKPEVNTNATISERGDLYLAGNLKSTFPALSSAVGPGASDPTTKMDVAFNCSVAMHELSTEGQADSEWAITMCQLPMNGARVSSPVFDQTAAGKTHLTFIMLNTTGDTGMLQVGKTTVHFNNSGGASPNPPWTTIAIRANMSISVSVCVSALDTMDVPVRIRGRSGRDEPTLSWDATTKTYNTSSIRNLYVGASSGLTLEGRGVLSMEPRANWSEGRIDTAKFATVSSLRSELTEAWPAAFLCIYCRGDLNQNIRVHRVMVSIFQDVLKSTGSLPLSMQTLWTMLGQMAYYDFLPEFDVKREATMTSFVPIAAPAHVSGIVVVAIITSLHIMLVVLMTMIFLTDRHASLPGNLWQSFGQMANGDLAELAARASSALDKEVDRHLRDCGEMETHVELTRPSKDGKTLRLIRKRRVRKGLLSGVPG
ncbi:hypothetical protein B0T16DRAFT_391058 [Cercophora newfieldiana]|uniref:Uncharacterized protein n=1 Tax=Cercophora newfieldiana TaxID=92897 RepID=A0AA39Y5Z1_9PEZI|nr:hypothetical protein B0T16DRAFT_391058 [Cercophora newfieldiana]